MKKKLTALALVVALVAMLFAGMSIAYFTDTDEAVNVFTVGNIDIELDEEVGVTDSNGNPANDRVIGSGNGAVYRNIVAGNKLKKEPTVTNTGSAPAYVRVTVIINNYDKINSMIEYFEAQGYSETEIETLVDEVFNGWGIVYSHNSGTTGNDMRMTIPTANAPLLRVDSTFTTLASDGSYCFSRDNWFKTNNEEQWAQTSYGGGYGTGFSGGYYAHILNDYELCYAYYLYLEPGQEYTLFSGLNCPDIFDQEQAAMFQNLTIELYADAIQAEGFADAKDAFDALEDAHPLLDRSRVTNPPVVFASTAAELEAALASAQPGDAVALAADVETVTIDETLENVTIVGNGYDAKIIITDSASLTDVTITELNANNEAASGSYYDGGAIVIKSGATVNNLVIENSTLNGSGGRSSAVSVSEPTAEITISNCVIDGTKYVVYGNAPVAKLTIENCEIKNHSSWLVLLNGSASAPAELTITGNVMDNCTDGIAKYLGGSVPTGSFITFTNNILTNCAGHDGSDAKWFTIPAGGTVTVSGNTLDGADWVPGEAQGLK